MSESTRGFDHAVDQYVASLARFVHRRQLPAEWFNKPDHLAVKCLDGEHYEDMVETWGNRANFASYTWMNGRRLASIHLGQAISLDIFGSVEWLEIMEPRPEKIDIDRVGIDHAEFVYSDFTRAGISLANRSIPYELQSNPNHSWLSVLINPMDQELKLNDRPLADIVAHEIETGCAEVL